MKNIWEKIKAFFCAADKQLHMLACFAIALAVFVFLLPFIPEKWEWSCCVIAVIVSAAAGALKEVYDYKHPKTHDFEWKDIVADVLGILAALGDMLIYLLN